MSTRTTLRPETILTAGNMGATSFQSTPTVLQGLSMINYAVTWTGTTPTGTLTLQFSDDYALSPDGRSVVNAGTWNDVPVDVNGAANASIAISGNTGNGMIDVWSTGAYAARLSYTRSGGTGTMTAVVTGKVS